MKVSVVIPLYNEVENIDPLCNELHEALSTLKDEYEIIFVDDGSQDETWQKLKEQTQNIPHIRLIQLRRNFGQTAAMSAGFHHSKGDIVVTLDGDLQNDPHDIPTLLEHIEKTQADVVSGWRKDRKDPFLSRRLPSMIANFFISKITGVYLHDYGCTLKAYRREVLQDIRLYGEMHRFIPALASWVGGKIDEVVVNHKARQFGKSKYGLSRSSRVVLDLITVKFLLRYSMGPIQIFGKIAGLFGLPGLVTLVVIILANFSHNIFGTELGADLVKRPFWIIISFMLIFLGMQFISMGLLAEIQIRTYHESQDKHTYTIKETFDG